MVFPLSKLRKQRLFAKIFKIQGGLPSLSDVHALYCIESVINKCIRLYDLFIARGLET